VLPELVLGQGPGPGLALELGLGPEPEPGLEPGLARGLVPHN